MSCNSRPWLSKTSGYGALLLLSSAALAAPVTQERPALVSPLSAETSPLSDDGNGEIAVPQAVTVKFTKPVGYIQFLRAEPGYANANCTNHTALYFRTWNKDPRKVGDTTAYPLRHARVYYTVPDESYAFFSLGLEEKKEGVAFATDDEGIGYKYLYSCFDTTQAITTMTAQVHGDYSTDTNSTKKTVSGNFKYGPDSLTIEIDPKERSVGASNPKGVKLTATVKNKSKAYTKHPRHLIRGATVEFKLPVNAPRTMTLGGGFTEEGVPRQTVVTKQTNGIGATEEVTVLNSQPSGPVEIEVSEKFLGHPEKFLGHPRNNF